MKAKLDERQILERGKVFEHGVIAAVILLVGNAALHSSGIVWASGFAQSIIIMFAIVTIISVEMVIRDVYFGFNQFNKLPVTIIFILIALMLSIFSMKHIVDGDVLFENGTLTPDGEYIPTAIMALIIAVCMTITFIKNRRKPED
ncbi:MAG: hypothetical protein FWH17_05685 [Oscillospiraceae bacterium]|nr:hypothetical protein [Oscillospiraceae bacterium]